jgi:hypothetical protein
MNKPIALHMNLLSPCMLHVTPVPFRDRLEGELGRVGRFHRLQEIEPN